MNVVPSIKEDCCSSHSIDDDGIDLETPSETDFYRTSCSIYLEPEIKSSATSVERFLKPVATQSCIAKTKNGKNCAMKAISGSSFCFDHDRNSRRNSLQVQKPVIVDSSVVESNDNPQFCYGKTNGKDCTRKALPHQIFCLDHSKTTKVPSNGTSKTFPAVGKSSNYRCICKTKSGKNCAMRALPGSQYCFDHGNNISKGSIIAKMTPSNAPLIKKVEPVTPPPEIAEKQASSLVHIVHQCPAKTRLGKDCEMKAISGSKYCFDHERIFGKREKKIVVHSSSVNSPARGSCIAKTKTGKDCLVKAQVNSIYCFDHGRNLARNGRTKVRDSATDLPVTIDYRDL